MARRRKTAHESSDAPPTEQPRAAKHRRGDIKAEEIKPASRAFFKQQITSACVNVEDSSGDDCYNSVVPDCTQIESGSGRSIVSHAHVEQDTSPCARKPSEKRWLLQVLEKDNEDSEQATPPEAEAAPATPPTPAAAAAPAAPPACNSTVDSGAAATDIDSSSGEHVLPNTNEACDREMLFRRASTGNVPLHNTLIGRAFYKHLKRSSSRCRGVSHVWAQLYEAARLPPSLVHRCGRQAHVPTTARGRARDR